MYEAHPKVDIADLTHDLLYEMTDLDRGLAENYIRRAAIRMAREGNILRRKVDICIQDCVHNYLLESDDCMDVVAVMRICLTTCGCCHPTVVRLTSGCRPCACCGKYMSWLEGNEIYFNPANCGDTFEVSFSVAPTLHACELDADFANKYYDVLLQGALAYAYAVPGKPWSNTQLGLQSSQSLAGRYAQLFTLGISQLAVETMTHGQRGMFQAKRPRAV